MTFDPRSGTVLLFGGRDGSYRVRSDLWSWNGTSWRLLSPTDPEGDGNPSPREASGLVWDATRRELLLFGGNTDEDRLLPSITRWSPTSPATAWRSSAAQRAPAARSGGGTAPRGAGPR
jgi:hypothetical protein